MQLTQKELDKKLAKHAKYLENKTRLGIRLGKQLDLSGMNLSGLVLDFHGANLQDAKFDNAIFDYATLDNAIFTGASANRARFKGALMNSRSFKNAKLNGAVFDGTNLTLFNFENAKLCGASFVATNLFCANLKGADFSNANLSGADLSNAHLDENTKLDGANLHAVTRESYQERSPQRPVRHQAHPLPEPVAGQSSWFRSSEEAQQQSREQAQPIPQRAAGQSPSPRTARSATVATTTTTTTSSWTFVPQPSAPPLEHDTVPVPSAPPLGDFTQIPASSPVLPRPQAPGVRRSPVVLSQHVPQPAELKRTMNAPPRYARDSSPTRSRANTEIPQGIAGPAQRAVQQSPVRQHPVQRRPLPAVPTRSVPPPQTPAPADMSQDAQRVETEFRQAQEWLGKITPADAKGLLGEIAESVVLKEERAQQSRDIAGERQRANRGFAAARSAGVPPDVAYRSAYAQEVTGADRRFTEAMKAGVSPEVAVLSADMKWSPQTAEGVYAELERRAPQHETPSSLRVAQIEHQERAAQPGPSPSPRAPRPRGMSHEL